jgi:16S rRNA (guanine527-N7)-methyltransferase
VAGASRRDRAPAPHDLESFIDATGVSRETALRFETWRALLEKWSTRINLVGPSTLAEFWTRHALDAIQVVDFVPSPEGSFHVQRWADLGSGAGFPGLAAAIALEGAGWAVEVHLIEANEKKAAFLREAVRATGAPAVVRAMRIEDLGKPGGGVSDSASDTQSDNGGGERFDVITARACAPLEELLNYASRLWKPETKAVFLKGRDAELELTAARKSWRFASELQPSRSDERGRVVLIERLEHVRQD